MLYIFHILFYVPFLKKGMLNNKCSLNRNIFYKNICYLNYNNKNTYSNELPIQTNDNKIINSNLTSILLVSLKNVNSSNISHNQNHDNSFYGFDNRISESNESKDLIHDFITNSKKKAILDLLENNHTSTSIHHKLDLISDLYDFQEKSICKQSIFKGNFWKDWDFI